MFKVENWHCRLVLNNPMYGGSILTGMDFPWYQLNVATLWLLTSKPHLPVMRFLVMYPSKIFIKRNCNSRGGFPTWWLLMSAWRVLSLWLSEEPVWRSRYDTRLDDKHWRESKGHMARTQTENADWLDGVVIQPWPAAICRHRRINPNGFQSLRYSMYDYDFVAINIFELSWVALA